MTHRKLIATLSAMLLFAGLSATSFSQKAEHEDFDAYKLRIDAFWFYASPSGYIQASTTNSMITTPIDLQKDLGLPDYSTFIGKADWKFTRKNHLYPRRHSIKQDASDDAHSDLHLSGPDLHCRTDGQLRSQYYFLAPGYQYDIIRRKRGHLGIAVQMDLHQHKGNH